MQSLKKLREEHQKWALGTERWHLKQNDKDGQWCNDGILYDISKLDEEKFYDATFFRETWFIDEVKVKGKDGKKHKETLSQRIIVTYSIKYRDYLRHVRERQVARAAATASMGAKAVALVVVFLFVKKLTPFRHHQALQHNLPKVMKSIFFLGMLAHYLRKLFLCESNHKSVFLKLNIDVLIEHFKFTDFLLSTYADTLFGTLSISHF